jgi:hypothetical protein
MGRSKRKSRSGANSAIKRSLCNICQLNQPIYSQIPSCSSCRTSSQQTVCRLCLQRHIFTSISADIISQVTCPEQGCTGHIMNNTIQTTLAGFGRTDLWEEYSLKSNWSGTSEQWIKRFSVKCPGCQVPIEKNGGCDRMLCRHCSLSFSWSHAKTLNRFNNVVWWRKGAYGIVKIFYRCLVILLMFCFIKFFLFHKERIMSTGYNLLLNLQFLFYCVFHYFI